jgi:hypothetical protein
VRGKEMGNINSNKYGEILLGVYDNSNFAKVNIATKHSLGQSYTGAHELMHFHLTHRTLFGVLEYFLDKMSKVHKPIKEIRNTVFFSMQKTHESVSTFFEVCAVIHDKGYENLIPTLKDIRRNRSSYYKYIEPILFLLKDYKNIPIEEKAQYIQWLGLLALSVNITNIPKEVFCSPSKLKSYLEGEQNARKYRPDTRYKIMVKKLKSYLEEHKVLPEFQDLLDLSELDAESPDDENTHTLIEYLKSLPIIPNEKIEGINRVFTSLQILENTKEIDHRIHPTMLQELKAEKITFTELKDLYLHEVGALAFSIVVVNDKITTEYNYGIVFFHLLNKTAYITIASNLESQDIINISAMTPLLLFTPFYNESSTSGILGIISTESRRVYIYNDVPFASNANKLKSLIGEDPKARFINFEIMWVIVIRLDINKNHFVLQPIANENIKNTILAAKNNKLPFSLADLADGSEFDPWVFRDNTDIEDLNIIVNSLFQL